MTKARDWESRFQRSHNEDAYDVSSRVVRKFALDGIDLRQRTRDVSGETILKEDSQTA
jgi:hypothetical protein